MKTDIVYVPFRVLSLFIYNFDYTKFLSLFVSLVVEEKLTWYIGSLQLIIFIFIGDIVSNYNGYFNSEMTWNTGLITNLLR